VLVVVIGDAVVVIALASFHFNISSSRHHIKKLTKHKRSTLNLDVQKSKNMLNSWVIDRDKCKKRPEQKFKNLSQEVLDISISFQNIQKYSKNLKKWERRCNLKMNHIGSLYETGTTDGHSLITASRYDFCKTRHSLRSLRIIHGWQVKILSKSLFWKRISFV